jgi:hypothetical protein
MAGPMKQNIPLADTVRALSGDSAGLVKELQKERGKLEREIQKSLDAAGKVDAALMQKLNTLKGRETAAGIFADRDRGLAGMRRGALEARGTIRDIGGVMELARGGVNVGNLMDLSQVLGDAGGALARNGMVGLGNRLASLGASVAAGVARVAIPVTAGIGAFQGGMALGQAAGNTLFGDPNEMLRSANAKGAVLARIQDARHGMDGAAWWSMARRAMSYEDPEVMAAAMANAAGESKLGADTMAQLRGRAADKTSVRAWRWTSQAEINKRLDAAMEIKLAELVRERVAAQDDAQKAYRRNPETARSRAIANDRALLIRAVEDSRWSGEKDWSGS